MSVRVRWFKLGLRAAAFPILTEAMLKDAYDDARGWGFRLAHSKKNEIEGSFHERIDRSDIVVDPFGMERDVKWVEYRQTSFRLFTTFPNAEIANPRGVRNFFDRISGYLESDLTISGVEIDLPAWLGHLESELGRVAVVEIRATDVTVSPSAYGTVVLSGSQDVRKDLSSLLSGRKSRVDRLTFTWPKTTFSCELRADGSVSIDEDIGSSAIRILRRSVAQTVNPTESLGK